MTGMPHCLKLAELDARAEDPSLWNDAEAAQKVMRERGRIASLVDGVRAMERETADTLELIELAEAEGDAAMVKDAMATLSALAEAAKTREIESLLSGEADGRDAFMEINAGSGGTEAQDWAEMLLRMYTRWAEARGSRSRSSTSPKASRPGSNPSRCRSPARMPMAG